MKGPLFALAAVVLFTVEAAVAKVIGPEINAAQVTLLRSLVQLAILALVTGRGLRAGLRTDRPGAHVWRGALSATGAVAYFYVFAHMPFGVATVIFFSSILFTTALAGPFLHEAVGWRRWSATLIGFFGMLLVVRPDAVPFDLALVAALLLALNGAAINLATKGLTRSEGTLTMMLWIALTTLAVSVPWALATWTWPDATVLGLMFLIALVGTAGQYASITAFRHADASGLAPVYYVRIVLSGLIGFYVFHETVDALTLLGSAVITGSAVYITLHEGRRSAIPPRQGRVSPARERR